MRSPIGASWRLWGRRSDGKLSRPRGPDRSRVGYAGGLGRMVALRLAAMTLPSTLGQGMATDGDARRKSVPALGLDGPGGVFRGSGGDGRAVLAAGAEEHGRLFSGGATDAGLGGGALDHREFPVRRH